jgi:hypothetical protein
MKPENDTALAKWKDPNDPFIRVVSMAFTEGITLTEVIETIIEESQDKQNIPDQFLSRFID